MDNRLFEFTMKLFRGEGCKLPEDVQGSYVTCYASAPDPLSAIRRAVTAVRGMRYIFDDILGTVREIQPDTWSDYLRRVWPKALRDFPDQAELPLLIEQQAVFFGPFTPFKLPPAGKNGSSLDNQLDPIDEGRGD